ncbi:type II toxin-antitoxin system HicB family antitoxin [Candidatus Palauibacter sp.]|uniref:type II toxin-antitoxin system HicB family antitoxin n=1 Tax=Candidatus Palauibacter sp. TaxID=3101350 RepID=UPI003C6FFFC0
MFLVTLVLEPQPEGGYTVKCPYLPELITEGDTRDEAIANSYDALAAVIELYAEAEQGCGSGSPEPQGQPRRAEKLKEQ